MNPRPSPWQGDALPLSHSRITTGGQDRLNHRTAPSPVLESLLYTIATTKCKYPDATKQTLFIPPSFPPLPRHSRTPPVIPAQAGIHTLLPRESYHSRGDAVPPFRRKDGALDFSSPAVYPDRRYDTWYQTRIPRWATALSRRCHPQRPSLLRRSSAI